MRKQIQILLACGYPIFPNNMPVFCRYEDSDLNEIQREIKNNPYLWNDFRKIKNEEVIKFRKQQERDNKADIHQQINEIIHTDKKLKRQKKHRIRLFKNELKS
jgi:hypothetical protein